MELAFTVEMRECPHGKFLPSSFHGGRKGGDISQTIHLKTLMKYL